MRLPSVKTLCEKLHISYAQADRWRAFAKENGGKSGGTELVLSLASDLMRAHGVEYISAGKNRRSPAIAYVNMGDPYIDTLMCVRGRYVVGCWGDIVERGNYE